MTSLISLLLYPWYQYLNVFYQLIWFLICLILHRFFRTIYLPWLSCSATPSTGDWKLLAATSPETKYIMMTSSNGSIFRVTCPLCGEFIGHRSPHKGQWRGVLMFSLRCAWINCWANNRDAGDLRSHRAHYDVTIMNSNKSCQCDSIQRLVWRL